MRKPLSLTEILDCGLDAEIASLILAEINQWLGSASSVECWQHFSRNLLKPEYPFSFHQLLYTTTFPDGEAPAWFPTTEEIQETNLWEVMRSLNISTYPELHTWSVANRADFWELMIKRLKIKFQKPYTTILDLSQGLESPQWLVNARFNIVESCFLAPESALAIVFPGEKGNLSSWTYGELHILTNRVANGLKQMGMQPGDAIAITMPMTPTSVAIYLGIIAAGCVVVAIADSFAPPEIATRLRIGGAKAIFTQDCTQRGGKSLPLYSKVIEANAPQAIVLAQSALSIPVLRPGDLIWSEFLSYEFDFTPVLAQGSDRLNILFSSGTTGEPKAIPWNQTTPIKCAVDGHLHQDIHPGDVVAWPTNLGWMMGPWSIYASFINRATLALYDDSPTTRAFGEFIQAAGVTMLGLVPSLVSVWKSSNCMQGLDWSQIRAFSSTGECSNPQDMLYLMSLAGYKPIIEYCGGTEIGGGYITGTVIQPCIPATFSTPTLGLDVIILDPDGNASDRGEGFMSPPSIGLSTELLNQDHHQVYFADAPPSLRRHGDRFQRLSNGYWRSLGRIDDTMNLGGIKVSAAEIEGVLNGVTGVCETAAIALSPPTGGPSQLIIYAVVDLSNLPVAELKSLFQTAIKTHLNPLFKIHEVVVVESLPRTASQKIMRRLLRDQSQ
ncbi:AMP-binding protein [Merismopedia glauca]|uniref:AMP-dependent synthetase n=1 Tax=Merismopedia glauca CCAP 1448/3 TaxID=1296344 RepID=A0A2T1CAE1_9CYAN|nr:AMP-binding protein [Merismopedia glauca]PSB05246.1 AMP-dependent synthetase [Merismopedia glauca CCAP 1448/3]